MQNEERMKEQAVEEKYGMLLAIIPIGAKNAIPMRKLAERLEITDRKCRELILEAAKAGCRICSGNRGYYIPENLAEECVYYEREKRRIETTRAKIKHHRKRILEAGLYVD